MYWQLFGFLQVLLVVLMAYSHLLQRIFGPRPIVVGLEENFCPWLVQQVIRAFGVLADLEKNIAKGTTDPMVEFCLPK